MTYFGFTKGGKEIKNAAERIGCREPLIFYYFLKIYLFIYLFQRKREREGAWWGGAKGERESQADALLSLDRARCTAPSHSPEIMTRTQIKS